MAMEIKHLTTQMHDLSTKAVGFACDAVDEIRRLRAENAELKESQRWRKFSEEKPKEKQWIFVYVENPSRYGTYVELRRWDLGCKFDVENQELYTLWMPLPKEPEVK